MSTGTGAHHLGTHGWLRLVLAALLVLVFILTLEASPAAGAAGRVCRVTNAGTGQAYATLQAAVNAAKSGAHLTVTGTCHGSTLIDKNLVVEGRRTKRSGRPTLDGDDQARPLVVRRTRPGRSRGSTRSLHVTIRGLTIQNGRARPSLIVDGYGGRVGGGIWSDGNLKLADVVVRGNRAADLGGGIYTQWADLRLNGTTRITHNSSGYLGGGIMCWYGRVVLNDSASIAVNRAGVGGGVACWGGLYLNDSSSIADNRAGFDGGGGYIINTELQLNDAASIRDNRAYRSGAGIYFEAYIDEENWTTSPILLSGTSSITGNRAGGPDTCCGQGCRKKRSEGGGLWAGPATVLTMTETSVISGNDATCGGGGLYSQIDPDDGGALTGVSCAPQTLANVYGNTPDDCSLR